jgi:hypothetical protein
MKALVCLALFAASVCYAGEPKITVGDCKPVKGTATFSIWHHPQPAPKPVPLWPGVWPVLGWPLWLR